MYTLLLRLAAPLQSWGVDSSFDVRRTERAPTKSGVIGMLSAALGWTRDKSEWQHDLSIALRFGVRSDKEGELLKDFQIAKGEKDSYVTNRYYLSDAKFLVGLESEKTLLDDLEKALKNPHFPVFLGRRSCPPEGQVVLGIRNLSLEEALQEEPLLHEYREYERPPSLRLLIEPPLGERGHYFQKDQVVSFSKERREHTHRSVRETRYVVDYGEPDAGKADQYETDHDPYKVLQEGGQ